MLREMIGTLKYMQDKDVAESFGKEKKRIGAIIGYVDKELHKTPRLIQRARTREIVTSIPWKEQGLGKKWDKYMDEVFEKAKQKATNYMNLNLRNLNEEWDSQKKRDEYKPRLGEDQVEKDKKKALEKTHKDMLVLIKQLREEWDKVKDWKKPTNWM
jgi:hypothetical protein